MTADLSSLHTVRVHDSMRSQARAGERVAAVRAAQIDPSLHYRSARQADLWWRVHTAHAPQNSGGPLEIYRRIATSAALGDGPVGVIGVGAGGGEKEALVVQACAAQDANLHYIPIDVGLELALRSADAGAGLGITVSPVVGDVVAMAGADRWLTELAPAKRRLVTAYGITPNISPDSLFPRLHEMAGASGELLISANLLTSWEEVLPQYDNPQTAEWLWQLVLDWGLAPLLGPIRFEVSEVSGIPAVVALAEWGTDAQIELDGEFVQVCAGQPLRLFTSRRFTEELFSATCEAHGFEVRESFVDPSGQEGVWRVCPSTPAERT